MRNREQDEPSVSQRAIPEVPEADDSPTMTRFGMLSPTIGTLGTIQTVQTRHLHFRGPEDIGFDDEIEGPVFSHAAAGFSFRTLLKTNKIFRRLFRGTLLLLLLGGVYFLAVVFLGLAKTDPSRLAGFDSKTNPAPQVGTQSPGDIAPPTDVRFFNLLSRGNRFVYLIDSSALMGYQFQYHPMELVKPKVLDSIGMLKATDSFAVLFYNLEIVPVHAGPEGVSLVPADVLKIMDVSEAFKSVSTKDSCDLKNAIFSAFSLNPEVVFLICDSTNASLLSEEEIRDISTVVGKRQLLVVELGKGTKPLKSTQLEILVQSVKGQYQWADMEKLRSPGLVGSGGDPEESFRIAKAPSLQEMLRSDFQEGYIQPILSAEDIAGLPFGKSLIAEEKTAPSLENAGNPPKVLQVSRDLIREVETDARIVYMSGFLRTPLNPPLLRDGANYRLHLWVEGAKAEIPAAEYLIGLCYRNAVRGKMDVSKANSCFHKSAEGGCLPAMSLFAESFSSNPAAARYWFEKAAIRGEPYAQMKMGSRFSSGSPYEQFQWFLKAAKQGLPEAQFYLARCYEIGTGVERNREEALHWYEKAARENNQNAVQNLDRLNRILERERNPAP